MHSTVLDALLYKCTACVNAEQKWEIESAAGERLRDGQKEGRGVGGVG